jgi:hypothetical protein
VDEGKPVNERVHSHSNRHVDRSGFVALRDLMTA